jgi:hypothetical protein
MLRLRIGVQAIDTGARMRIQIYQRRGLCHGGVKDGAQDRMLQNVCEIAGVKAVAIAEQVAASW